MTKVVIMAAGEGERWGGYTGVPKHLISPEDNGEVLLARLVRQLKERMYTDVVVTGPQDYAEHLPDHVRVVTPPELGDTDQWLGTQKFVNTTPYWNMHGRTVIFWGDCWLDDAVVDTIMRCPYRQWLNWCRLGMNRLTGTAWGENFAVSFWPTHHKRYLEAIRVTAEAHRNGVINRSGGWEVLRAYEGARGEEIRTRDRKLPSVRDVGYMGTGLSDDFDYPEDLDRWREAYVRN